jgi:hypothetical protein
MGAKYTTNASSGYNSSPPADDGSQVASNLVKWSTHKTKLTDPLKTFIEEVNTALVAAFDYAVRRITSSDSLVAGDHMRTVEIGPSVSSSITVTLADAATMTNVYRVFIKNSGSVQCTIARATAGDTIDGAAANITIPAGASYCLTTNNAANGYLLTSVYPVEITNLTEETAPAVSDTIAFYDLSATALRKLELGKLVSTLAATQAEQETGTATNKIVTPGRQHSHPSASKAWVKFAGATGVVAASYNVDSVSRSAAGTYTITFTTDFSSVNYVGVGVVQGDTRALVSITTPAAGTCVVTTSDSNDGATEDYTAVHVVFFGDQ